jgi:DNA-binding response OmpR family regulator
MADECNQFLHNIQTPIQTILLVEDDTTISEFLVRLITQETNFLIFTVPDGPQALDLVQRIKPALFILDYWLPTTHGIELYDQLHAFEGLEQVPAIMLSVNAPLHEMLVRHITFIRKPFDMYQLLEAIHNLLKE